MALPTKPGNTDRGWNDPPMFLYSGQTENKVSPPKRSLLTKRVAFPETAPAASTQAKNENTPVPSKATSPPPAQPPMVSSTGAGDLELPPSAAQVVLLPPRDTAAVPSQPVPILVPTKNDIECERTEMNAELNTKPSGLVPKITLPHFQDDEQLFNYVFTRLEKVLRQVAGNLQERACDDVRKRLECFQAMWGAGKITQSVKINMAKLSLALGKRNCDLAHELHLGLMLDHVSEVGQWMVAIKRLIQEARQVPPVSPEQWDDDDDESVLWTINKNKQEADSDVKDCTEQKPSDNNIDTKDHG